MTPPTPRVSIPSVPELYGLLGSRPPFRGTFRTATYEWRRQYLTRLGKSVSSLLDWESAQDECRDLATSFLSHDKNGEDFWPSNDGLSADVPEYPKDQAVIIDLLSKLFWRQNQTDHSNRRYYEARRQQADFAFADQTTPTIPSDPKAVDPLQDQPKKTKTLRRRTQRISAPVVQDQRDMVESSSDEADPSSPENTARNSLIWTVFYDPNKYPHGFPNGATNTINADGTGERGHSTSQGETSNDDVHEGAAGKCDRDYNARSLAKRKRNKSSEEQPARVLAVIDAKRTRLSEGFDSPALMQAYLPGYAMQKVNEQEKAASKSFSGPAAVTSTAQAFRTKQRPANPKTAEIFFSIITARSPRLHSVTWVRGALHNRAVGELFDEISQFVRGSHIHHIVFTLRTSNGAYSTTVERGDENVYTRMRKRWTRIIREDMAEGQNSEFEVELEPKYGAGLENAQAAEDDFDIIL